jgi:hypothetical protein
LPAGGGGHTGTALWPISDLGEELLCGAELLELPFAYGAIERHLAARLSGPRGPRRAGWASGS